MMKLLFTQQRCPTIHIVGNLGHQTIMRSGCFQVPLEALSAELQAHLQVLRNKLVEVINEHYGDFVSLSSKLVNVDSAVIRMQKPLIEIKVLINPCMSLALQMFCSKPRSI